MEKIKSGLKSVCKAVGKKVSAIWKSWYGRYLIIALVLDLVLEVLGRRSIILGFAFLIESPFVFLYNTSIVFFTLLFANFLRKRVFGVIIISTIWLICGVVNFVVLGFRTTPFAAIDLLMVKDTISMIDIYYSKFQQVIIVIAAILVIIGLVALFIKTPKIEGNRAVKKTMLVCLLTWGLIWVMTNFSVKYNLLSDNFSNLSNAYKDYGFAYCFTNSIIDNGISKPDNYSEEVMMDIKSDLDGYLSDGGEVKPNIIVIQLESFIDVKGIAGVTCSEDPVPNFTALKEEYPSGYFTVPAVGAGTANTEFEVLTGITTSYFGAGEYPYKTTVNDTPAETLCCLLKEQGYGTYAIHNNRGSFYDRLDVYDMMGFDAFTPLEYMYNIETTSTGWAKDKTLIDDILKDMDQTEGQDFVYTISVQGHGRYPSEEGTWTDHVQVEYDNSEMETAINYYVNQTYEMDQMIGELVDELNERGEDYVLLLYGDHLPSLEFTDDQMPSGTLYNTEYVLVNNIGLNMKDRDIYSYEISSILLDVLNIPMGYAQKAYMVYEGDDLTKNLELIAYDMLFGERYLYGGDSPVIETDMQYGVSQIQISSVDYSNKKLVVYGENFNDYSKICINGDEQDTVYVDRNTVMLSDFDDLDDGDKINVSQIDRSHNVLSSTAEYVFDK